jgi:hypothetical protein
MQKELSKKLLGYISNATNDNESAFDGESFDGNDFVDFIVLIITKFDHSRSCTAFDTAEVPLGYKSTIAGEFGINIRKRMDCLKLKKVYLEDKLLGTEFDLSKGTYILLLQ